MMSLNEGGKDVPASPAEGSPPTNELSSGEKKDGVIRKNIFQFLHYMQDGKNLLALLSASVVIIFLMLYLKPWVNYVEPGARDISSAWFKQIGRYGIIGRFPPEEDFHVGDVYAIIGTVNSDYPDDAYEKDEKKDHAASLEGRSVRIGYINLRSDMDTEVDRPNFPDTKIASNGKPDFSQGREESTKSSNSKILLSRIAFPTIILNRGSDSEAGFRFLPAALNGGGKDAVFDEIRIPNAETYGAPAVNASARLILWCKDEQTKLYCEDGPLRRALSFSISPRVYDKDESGNYVYKLKVQLVSRVYVTRELKIRRLVNNSNGLGLGSGGGTSEIVDISEAVTKVNTEGEDVGNLKILEDRATRSSQFQDSGTARIISSFASVEDVGLDAVFPRPMVFGFKAITIDVPPNKPEKKQ